MRAYEEEKIRKYLPENIKITLFQEIDSTNKEARRQIDAGNLSTALYVSEMQTAGRGRMGRSFYSPKSTGIYMTLAVPVHAAFEDSVRITAKTAVSVLKGLEAHTGAALSIKWVNDIYCGEKKAAGILVEAVPEDDGKSVKALVIGIGINLSTEEFPEEIREIAGGLGEGDADRNEIVGEIVKNLLFEVTHLTDLTYLEIYRSRSNVIGQMIVFGSQAEIAEGSAESGKAVGIDDDGALIVEMADGTQRFLRSGEVSVRVRGNIAP